MASKRAKTTARQQHAADPSPPKLELNPQKTTPAMRNSLEELYSSLLCPLCNQLLDEPSTLPCSHTFCLECMDTYAADNWACPIKGCGFPLACRGAREGSYLKTNPQIQTVVSSLQEIAHALNRAPREWWKEESEEEEEVDFQPNYTPKSPGMAADEEQEDSPESDSQKTETFDMPPTNTRPKTNHHEEMNAIAETSMEEDNRSCGLPSQSPGCSPIAVMASQASVPTMTTQRKETPTVRFRQEATTVEAEEKFPSIPRVLVASALSAKDRKMVDSLVDANKIQLTKSDDTNDGVDFAVCGNAEMETCDGFLVGRTYGYLLAVARSIPIVNISYFAAANDDNDVIMPPHENHKHQVIGDTTSSEWMAPQRAIKHKGDKLLLDGYTILLSGDFATLPRSPSTKRSRSGVAKKMDEESQETYSLNRLECLLTLCGATVVRDVASLVGVPDNVKVAVIIRPDPHPRDWRAARKELQDFTTLPLIRGNWLLDSISDFSVKNFDEYTQAKK